MTYFSGLSEYSGAGQYFPPAERQAVGDSFAQSRQKGGVDELLAQAGRVNEVGTAGKIFAQSERISASFAQQNVFTLSLLTQEGDTVDVSFSAEQRAGFESVAQSRGQRSFSSESISLSQRESLFVQIVGDINAEEREAIETLLADIDELLEAFFKGDTDGALNLATTLNFDSSQIATLSLDANSSTISTALTQYWAIENLGKAPGNLDRETINQDGPQQRDRPSSVSIFDVLEQLAQRAEELTESFAAQNRLRIEKPGDVVEKLLATLLEANSVDSLEELTASEQGESNNVATVAEENTA